MVIVAPTLQRGTWIKVPDRSDGMCGQERESKNSRLLDSWVDGRRNGFNIAVGISVPGSQFEWNNDLGLWHLF